MIVLLLGISIIYSITDAYVIRPSHAQEEPKSITMFINANGENARTRRNANPHNIRGRKRNAEDVLQDLYNIAASETKADSEANGGDFPEMRSKKRHKGNNRENKKENKYDNNNNKNSNIVKIFNQIADYFSKVDKGKSAKVGNTRTIGETKLDVVKLVNNAFNYLVTLSKRSNSKSRLADPRPIEFRSSDDSSLLYEINTKKLVEDVNSILSSKAVRGYVDSMAKKAAIIYRAVTKPE